MIKLNDDNIYVGQIKQILKDFNLPNCNVYKDGMTVVPNLHYIYNNGIYFGDKNSSITYKDSYYRGRFINNLTTNLRITNNIYDSYTHKYLGRYLRFLKDYDGIDLMSMYNCFTGEFASNINVTVNDRHHELITTSTELGTYVGTDNIVNIVLSKHTGSKSGTIAFSDCTSISTNVSPVLSTSQTNTLKYSSTVGMTINVDGNLYTLSSEDDYFRADIKISAIASISSSSLPSYFYKYTNNNRKFNSSDSNYILYTVPVRFDNNYTVAINCNGSIEVFSAVYSNGQLIEDETLFASTYERIRNCNFNRPYLYEKLKTYTPTTDELFKEESLMLIVKVPTSIKSSVVILEGDFRNGCKFDRTQNSILLGRLLKFKETNQKKDSQGKTTSEYEMNAYPTWFGNYDYTSKPELLDYTNSKNNFVLATRLIEYLTGNAITKISEGYDIRKAQEKLISKGYIRFVYPGIWGEDERKGLYAYANDNLLNSDYFDVVSYLDTSIENKMGGLD